MITRPHVKINIGLNILRKRNDGYHDIETLFFPSHQYSDILEIIAGDDYSRTSASMLARYDASDDKSPTLRQAISPDGKVMITVARAEGVNWDVLQDLTVKAYRLLDRRFSLPAVKIYLEKLSPVGAGLGGGSADGAYCMMMLSNLFGLGLSKEQLRTLAAKAGSDCAFFIEDSPMIGKGRGELLTPYAMPVNIYEKVATDNSLSTDNSHNLNNDACSKNYELKIVVPEGIHVSTKEAYEGIVPHLPPIPLEDALRLPVERWREAISNDFEESVFLKHPELRAIKDSLYDSGAIYASMSGSGSAIFALYPID